MILTISITSVSTDRVALFFAEKNDYLKRRQTNSDTFVATSSKVVISDLDGVDDFKKGELVKIRIPCADLTDSVFTHEDGRVSVVQEIACKVRKLGDNLPGNLGVPLRGEENIEAG
jgi:hypothetical protein